MTVAPETAQYGYGRGSNTIFGVCSQRSQEKFTNYVNLSSTNVINLSIATTSRLNYGKTLQKRLKRLFSMKIIYLSAFLHYFRPPILIYLG